MSNFGFARLSSELLNFGIGSRNPIFLVSHVSRKSLNGTKRLYSSVQRSKEEGPKVFSKTPNSGSSNNAMEEGNVIKLSEKPIKSKQVPTVVPSKHIANFEQALNKGKTQENFIGVLETFIRNNHPRIGHMEFLTTSLEYMEKFGLEGNLETYNAMLNIFPRKRFHNKNILDAIWPKMHPQVDLALEILTKMEENVIKPSLETYDLCEEIFGKASPPVQKCRRLAYWLTKLEEMFPSPLPKVLPEDEVEISKLALERMTKDPSPVVLYQEENKEKAINFIVGSQTLHQKSILESYDTEKPVYVEGPHFVWIRRLKRYYYTLRSHGYEGKEEDLEEGEGAVLAVCMTSTSCSQDTLTQWISRLEEQTPNLANIKVVFSLQTTQPANKC